MVRSCEFSHLQWPETPTATDDETTPAIPQQHQAVAGGTAAVWPEQQQAVAAAVWPEPEPQDEAEAFIIQQPRNSVVMINNGRASAASNSKGREWRDLVIS